MVYGGRYYPLYSQPILNLILLSLSRSTSLILSIMNYDPDMTALIRLTKTLKIRLDYAVSKTKSRKRLQVIQRQIVKSTEVIS